MKRLFLSLVALLLCVGMAAGCSSKEYAHYNAEKYDYQLAEPEKGDTMAVFHTSMGDITVRLFPKEAPKTVENFTTHAKEGYYDGQLFFRVIEDFFFQGGDPDNNGRGGESIWGKDFEDELCPYLCPYYGSLCMANAGSNTNSSQFFFVTMKDTDTFRYEQWNMDSEKLYQVDQAKFDKYQEVGGAVYLDYQLSMLRHNVYPDTYPTYRHTVFGQVVEGLDIMEAISHVKVAGEKEINEAKILNGPDQTEVVENKPLEDVVINSIEIYTYGK